MTLTQRKPDYVLLKKTLIVLNDYLFTGLISARTKKALKNDNKVETLKRVMRPTASNKAKNH